MKTPDFQTWMEKTLKPEEIDRVLSHGADAAFRSWGVQPRAYLELYERHRDEIHEALEENAEANGHHCPEVLIVTFRCSDLLFSEDGRKILMVWWMAERTAREITQS